MDKLGDTGIQQPLHYRTAAGQPQAQVFWQQCQHLVNHGSYHRGQVTTMLRQLGAHAAKEHGSDLRSTASGRPLSRKACRNAGNTGEPSGLSLSWTKWLANVRFFFCLVKPD